MDETINITVCYAQDDAGTETLDEEAMQDEFDEEIGRLKTEIGND